MVSRSPRDRIVLGSLLRLCVGGVLLLGVNHASRADDSVDAAAKAVAAKVGGAVKLEQRCDGAGSFLLFSQPSTGFRFLAHVEGARAFVSQPLTGQHDTTADGKAACRTTTEDVKPRDEGRCNSACTFGAAGLRYFYSRYYDWTRDETDRGRERYWFDLDFRDGVFLTKGVAKLASTNASGGGAWEVRRYEEQADFKARKFTTRYLERKQKAEDAPAYETTGLPTVAKGPLLVAGRSFDPKLAFSEFGLVHGKDRWKGKADLSATALARWSRDSLSFRVTVKDDVVRLGPGLHSDHLELWSGPAAFSALGLRHKAAPEDRQLMISMVDGKVLATVVHPESSDPPRQLEGHYEASSDGYVVEFTVPAAILISRPAWSDYNGSVGSALLEGDLLPLTLVISDSDQEGKQKSLSASSSLKWGDPVTFGRILLVGDHGLPELNRSAAREEL